MIIGTLSRNPQKLVWLRLERGEEGWIRAESFKMTNKGKGEPGDLVTILSEKMTFSSDCGKS